LDPCRLLRKIHMNFLRVYNAAGFPVDYYVKFI
jgi:hypothetical protein